MAVALKVTVVPGGCGAFLSAVKLLMVAGGGGPNVEITVVVAVRVTVQEPVPVQPPPLQPVKVEPVAGVVVMVTAVPLG